ncbi:MAG: helix-turn-helix domain-containing protein [Proteobacteria bacterium]|nr:helix-turn-helix domain-containing protein [Pseudomonadota bacterium]
MLRSRKSKFLSIINKIETAIIQNAVKVHGNARKAAFQLGVHPTTVTRKLQRNDAI